MGEMEGRNPAELSGRQQQRVAICPALAMAPAHVLLDEGKVLADLTVDELFEHSHEGRTQRFSSKMHQE
jgi:ABC-type methionine transport system ATPase subunit